MPVYSSDYESADPRSLPDRSAFRSHLDGLYMGYKWQCVEFARRWMYLNTGCVFDDVAMAHEIFRLRSVREVKTKKTLPLHSFRNGSRRPPEPGCLIIWEPGGEFEHTGHVAVVTEVGPESIRFAEQNVGHRIWPEGQSYARELHTKVTEDGEYWVECSFKDASILGWVIQTDDGTHSEPAVVAEPELFEIESREVEKKRRSRRSWLNVANADEAAYVEVVGGHRLASRDEDQRLYFAISESAHDELIRATGELHGLFMHATDHVLRDESLLARFNLPRALWPKVHESWDNRLNQMITGRFDFAVSPRGIKVYEYNADSAACHMECGKIQGRWAAHYGCEVGRDPGENLHPILRSRKQSAGLAVAGLHRDQASEAAGRLLDIAHAEIDRAFQEHAGGPLGIGAVGPVVDRPRQLEIARPGGKVSLPACLGGELELYGTVGIYRWFRQIARAGYSPRIFTSCASSAEQPSHQFSDRS